MENVKYAFDAIMKSEIFRLDGLEIDLHDAILILCESINDLDDDHDEEIWSYGEGMESDLGSFIVGAYWAMTEWHDGREGYRAMCALGSIFTPGMTDGPEPESSEQIVYELIESYFESKHPA